MSVPLHQDHDLDKDNPPPTPQRGEERVRRPLPIAADWVCPPITALPAEIAALAAQWPKGAYEAEGVAFAQYWRGNGRRRADWNAQWAARVQARHAAVTRDAKAGVSFGAGAFTAEDLRQAAEPVKAQKREDDRSAELRAMLEAVMEPADYATWLAIGAAVRGLRACCCGPQLVLRRRNREAASAGNRTGAGRAGARGRLHALHFGANRGAWRPCRQGSQPWLRPQARAGAWCAPKAARR